MVYTEEGVTEQGPFTAVPREWREMAGWVIDQRVGGSTSTGGFVTRNISNAINFLKTTEFPPTGWDPYVRAQFRKSFTRPRSTNFPVISENT